MNNNNDVKRQMIAKEAVDAIGSIMRLADLADNMVSKSGMWILCSDAQPLIEGEYMVVTPYCTHPRPMVYTPEGGWNTFRDSDGNLHKGCVIDEIIAWYDVPYPSTIINGSELDT